MKTCQVCLQPQPDEAETCAECGEGSFAAAEPTQKGHAGHAHGHKTDAPPPPPKGSEPKVDDFGWESDKDDSGQKDESKARRVGKGR